MDEARTIVILDYGWVSLRQLAFALRRRGHRVTWVHAGPSRRSVITIRAVTPTVPWIRDVHELTALLRRTPGVVDIITPEAWRDDAVIAAEASDVDPDVVELLRLRARWNDKLAVSRMLAAGGVLAPRTVDLDASAPVDPGPQLGYPYMVKGHIGAGGSSVVKVDAPEHFAEAVASLAGQGALYAEQFVQGQDYCYVAAYRHPFVVGECQYRAVRPAGDALGPSTTAESVHLPELQRTGRQVLELIGGRGLASIDTVMDADGRHWVIDVNLRAWQTVVTWNEAGHDFARDYAQAMELEPWDTATPASQVPPGHVVRVYPSAARDLLFVHPVTAAREMVTGARHYRRWLGSQYVASAMVSLAPELGRHVASRVRARTARP